MTRRARKRFLWTGVLLAAFGSLPLGPSAAYAGLAALDAYHVGRYHLANGEREKALEAFDDAVRMNPQFVQAYIARGKLYAEMGRFESALADLNFAIRIQPTHPEAFAYRGYALLSLGRPQESIPEFDMALRLDQSYARVYFLRGQALKLLGDDAGAGSSIALARRLDPTIETTRVVTAGADGSLNESIGLVSGDAAPGRTPGAGANLPPDPALAAQAPALANPGRVINFQDHPLLGDLRPPRNARPLARPAPPPHSHLAGSQSSGFPRQFGATPPRAAATRPISPMIPDITSIPETPLPSMETLPSMEALPSPETPLSAGAAPLDLVGTEPPSTDPAPSDLSSSDPAGGAKAEANTLARITLSPQTVVKIPAAGSDPAEELPKIVVIPAPTGVAADGSLPVVVTQSPPSPADSAATAKPTPAAAGQVEVPHVISIAPGTVAPGAGHVYKVDPPAGAPVIVADTPADTAGAERPAPSSLTASDLLKQHSSDAAGIPAAGQGEHAIASAVDSARGLLPGDAPSLAHVSDDGSNSPTRLAPAAATVTDAVAVSDAEAAYRQGVESEEAGDFKAALAAYAEASRLNPGDPLPACRRGHVLCELGRTAEALAEFDAAVRAAPGLSTAYFGRAHVKYLTDQIEDAVEDFSIALRLDDRHAQALLERGHCYARMGKPAEAAADRAAALALDPVLVENGPRYASEVRPRKPLPAGSIIVSDEAADDLAAAGEAAQSVDAAPSADAAPTATPAVPASAPAEPKSAFQNLFAEARPLATTAPQSLATAGDQPAAPAANSAASNGAAPSAAAPKVAASNVAMVSDSAPPTTAGNSTTSSTSVSLPADPALAALNGSPGATGPGVVALSADVVETADALKSDAGPSADRRDKLTSLLAERPGDASLYVERGRQSLGLGDPRAALDDVATALRLAPDDRAAILLRADALAAVEKFPAAHADYVQLLAENPNDPALYSGRGYVRLAMGQTGEAIDDFNTALRLDPKHGEVYCQRALAYALSGDRAASLSDFEAALKASPTDAEVFLCRAKALAAFGDKKQALADLNQALKLDPEKAEAYFERSRLYAEKGAYENAQADRRRAMQLDPTLR